MYSRPFQVTSHPHYTPKQGWVQALTHIDALSSMYRWPSPKIWERVRVGYADHGSLVDLGLVWGEGEAVECLFFH